MSLNIYLESFFYELFLALKNSLINSLAFSASSIFTRIMLPLYDEPDAHPAEMLSPNVFWIMCLISLSVNMEGELKECSNKDPCFQNIHKNRP